MEGSLAERQQPLEDLNKINSYSNQMAGIVPYAHFDRGG